MYMKNGLNKFLVPFPGIEKFLSGNTRSSAYTDHIIQFGLNNETRCDEVMPYLRNVGQVFGLEVHDMPFIVKFPLTLPVGQHPKDLGIVRLLMEPIIGPWVNWF